MYRERPVHDGTEKCYFCFQYYVEMNDDELCLLI